MDFKNAVKALQSGKKEGKKSVSYTHLRAHETD